MPRPFERPTPATRAGTRVFGVLGVTDDAWQPAPRAGRCSAPRAPSVSRSRRSPRSSYAARRGRPRRRSNDIVCVIRLRCVTGPSSCQTEPSKASRPRSRFRGVGGCDLVQPLACTRLFRWEGNGPAAGVADFLCSAGWMPDRGRGSRHERPAGGAGRVGAAPMRTGRWTRASSARH